jgi:hypothetical protein
MSRVPKNMSGRKMLKSRVGILQGLSPQCVSHEEKVNKNKVSRRCAQELRVKVRAVDTCKKICRSVTCEDGKEVVGVV